MGFKNAAQRKAVWASKNEQKKGSPAKQTIPDFKGTGDRLKRSMGQTVTGLSDERSADKIINKVSSTTKKLKPISDAITSYMDWNDDGKITTSDVVKEAVSTLVPVGAIVKGFKLANKARKFLSPFNHCDSEMMHSGGWGQVRKYNSPGTTGNKEGIKHNEKMREEIGTFKMPHSPLNKGHNIKASTTKTTSMVNDSIAAAKAWKEHKAAYLKKPNGQKEYDMEKGEFYYSPEHGKLRLIPTDDGEVQDRSGIEKWQLAPDRKSSRKIPGQDLDKVQVDERGEYAVNMHDRQDTIRPADGKNFKPFIQGKQSGKMESGYLSDDDYTIKDDKISPINQESEAEKRRRERAENEPGETQFFYNRKPKPATEEKVYNMTPDATPEESKAVRDKFDATYLKGRGPFTKKEGKKDACYHKVKSRVKVWPSAYASGQLVQCRKAGAANWGEKSKDK